jgi:hypothetical protein
MIRMAFFFHAGHCTQPISICSREDDKTYIQRIIRIIRRNRIQSLSVTGAGGFAFND